MMFHGPAFLFVLPQKGLLEAVLTYGDETGYLLILLTQTLDSKQRQTQQVLVAVLMSITLK